MHMRKKPFFRGLEWMRGGLSLDTCADPWLLFSPLFICFGCSVLTIGQVHGGVPTDDGYTNKAERVVSLSAGVRGTKGLAQGVVVVAVVTLS